MIPPSTPEERKVAWWVFGVLFSLAAIGLAGVAWNRSRECAASCDARGFADSELRFRDGGRFEMGLVCVCSEPRNAESSPRLE
jgi:hypothetical protein